MKLESKIFETVFTNKESKKATFIRLFTTQNNNVNKTITLKINTIKVIKTHTLTRVRWLTPRDIQTVQFLCKKSFIKPF